MTFTATLPSARWRPGGWQRQRASGNVLPFHSGRKAGEVGDVRCGNQDISGNRAGLCREDHVAVEGSIVRSSIATLTGLGPEFGGQQHGLRRDPHVTQSVLETIQPLNAPPVPQTEQFAAELIVSDLGNQDANAALPELLEP